MSFSVCCHFEHPDRDVWSGHGRDLDAWRALLRAFGGERLAVLNLAGYPLPTGVEEYDSFEQFVALHPGETMIQVEIGGEPLAEFRHPPRCWYVFGGTTVTLPTPDVEVERADERVSFHPVHVAHTVLWDRHRKGA